MTETKKVYYNEIIHSILEMGVGDNFIIALCHLIQNLSVDSLHIIGDIFDRGPRPDVIMNELMAFHDVDIQWGNHDISWMGAACGNRTLMANVVRMGISYNNFDALEDGYGINLRALSTFASQAYKDDPCTYFYPKVLDECEYDRVDSALAAKMHKAIAIIQFKLAGQLIKRHPEYGMEDRNLLEEVDFERGCLIHKGKEYPLLDTSFPTVDPKNPLQFTQEEEDLMNALEASSVTVRYCIDIFASCIQTEVCINVPIPIFFFIDIPINEKGEFEVYVSAVEENIKEKNCWTI